MNKVSVTSWAKHSAAAERNRNSKSSFANMATGKYSKQWSEIDGRRGNSHRRAISTMNPNNQDPETAELYKVYQMTGYAGGMTHPQELSKGHFDAQSINLENGQRMFDRFAQMRMDPDEDGNTVRSRLGDLFQSDEYKDAAYGSATRTMDPNTGDESKLAMIHRVFTQADAENEQRLAQESPIARRYMAVAQVESDSPDVLRTHTADELVTNPPLLKSLGINIEDYENNLAGQ
jgi:hypothetical protein